MARTKKSEPQAEAATEEPRGYACRLCGRQMLKMEPQVCGKCRAGMTPAERDAIMPKIRGGGPSWACALIKDRGAVVLVELNIPTADLAKYEVRRDEREFLPMVTPKLAAKAEEWWESAGSEAAE